MATKMTNTIGIGLSLMALKIEQRMEQAAREMAVQLLDDSINVEPKVPVHTGALMETGKVVKNGRYNFGVQFGSASVNYAVKVHENINKNINWSLPGSGPHFVSAKLMNQSLRNKYATNIFNKLRLKGL